MEEAGDEEVKNEVIFRVWDFRNGETPLTFQDMISKRCWLADGIDDGMGVLFYFRRSGGGEISRSKFSLRFRLASTSIIFCSMVDLSFCCWVLVL